MVWLLVLPRVISVNDLLHRTKRKVFYKLDTNGKKIIINDHSTEPDRWIV